MPKFAANITMLFTEYPFQERVDRVAASGLRGIEIQYPYGEDIDALASALRSTGLALALFNMPAGSGAAGDRGVTSDPRRVVEFRTGVEQAITIAEKLGCPTLSCPVGLQLPEVALHDQRAALRSNLEYAATETEKQGIQLVVEPINNFDIPGQLLCTPAAGFRLIEEIGHPNLLVQYDVYHAQRMQGNLAATIADHVGQIGHVQIADSPDRHEPGTGEIHYPYVFQQLDDAGYDGWVGLEYHPATTTEASLAWLSKWGYIDE